MKANLASTWAIGRYALIEALRNRLLWLAGAFILVGFVLAEFVSAVAITEVQQFQTGFMAAVLRVCAVFIVSLFVATSIVREFNDKVLELLLAAPIPRWTYFCGKLVGFSALALLIATMYSVALLIYAQPSAVLIWGVSLACELALVVAASLLALFTFSQVTVALSAVFGFYLLARSIGAFQLISDSPLLYSTALSQRALVGMLDALAYVLPDFERFTVSAWVIYGDVQAAALWPVLSQTVIYLGLLSGAALFDLYRRNL